MLKLNLTAAPDPVLLLFFGDGLNGGPGTGRSDLAA
jgi:hypothetical protein